MKHKAARHCRTKIADGEEAHNRQSGTIKLLICCATAVIVTFVLLRFIVGVAVVHGSSMVPALQDGDLVIFLRINEKYMRGDIVLVKTDSVLQDHVKRICGMPGEKIGFTGTGEFTVNGNIFAEPYIFESTFAKRSVSTQLKLANKEYFVMGDHRGDSRDSRDYGAVAEDSIEGKVILIIRGG